MRRIEWDIRRLPSLILFGPHISCLFPIYTIIKPIMFSSLPPEIRVRCGWSLFSAPEAHAIIRLRDIGRQIDPS